MMDTLIFLGVIYTSGVLVTWLIGAFVSINAMNERERWPYIRPKEMTEHWIARGRGVRARAYLWPVLPVLSVLSSLKKSEAMALEYKQERIEREYKDAMRAYEIEFGRKP